MTQRVIGLDVGTHAVRAAELRLGRNGAVTLTRFGQVALPHGVVSGGEVVDPGRLAEAIKRLWREVRFTSRRVIVGVGNQRVIVRPAEIPAMGENDLRSAVELQALDLIPMPLDQVVLDHQVLERHTDDDGNDMLSVLIVAAQKDVVRNLLTAVELAGLKPDLVDLIPFSLLRSLADVSGFADLGEGDHAAEAIVAIGGGVTTIVVHDQGIPRFVRMMMRGGEGFTEEIGAELGVGFEAAEALKRQVSAGLTDGRAAEAAQVLDGVVGDFIDEVKSSLDYHHNLEGSSPIGRVVLTGGGSRVPGLAEGLAEKLDVPVTAGAPLARIELARTGLSESQLSEAEDLAAVAVGLALAGRPVDRGARRLSLLPPEVGERNRARQQGLMVGAGVAVVMAGLLFLWIQRKGDVADVEAQVDDTRIQITQRQAEIAALSPLRDIESDFDTRSSLVAAALGRDVSWAKLVQELATVLPDDVWLDNFDGSAPQEDVPGGFSVSGRGANHTSSARWLLRIDALESVTGLWVPSSITNEGADGSSEVVFTSDAQLTDRALSRRLERYIGELLPAAPEPRAPSGAAAPGDGADSTEGSTPDGEGSGQ